MQKLINAEMQEIYGKYHCDWKMFPETVWGLWPLYLVRVIVEFNNIASDSFHGNELYYSTLNFVIIQFNCSQALLHMSSHVSAYNVHHELTKIHHVWEVYSLEN